SEEVRLVPPSQHGPPGEKAFDCCRLLWQPRDPRLGVTSVICQRGRVGPRSKVTSPERDARILIVCMGAIDVGLGNSLGNVLYNPKTMAIGEHQCSKAGVR